MLADCVLLSVFVTATGCPDTWRALCDVLEAVRASVSVPWHLEASSAQYWKLLAIALHNVNTNSKTSKKYYAN